MRITIILFLLVSLNLSAQTQINQITGITIQNEVDFKTDSKPILPFYDNYVLIQCSYNEINRIDQLWLTDGNDANTQKLLEFSELESIKYIQVIGKIAFVFVHSYIDSLASNGSVIKVFRIENNKIELDTIWPIEFNSAVELFDFNIINDKIYFTENFPDTTFGYHYFFYDIISKTVNPIMMTTLESLTTPFVWKNELYFIGYISGTPGTTLVKYIESCDCSETETMLDGGYSYPIKSRFVIQDQDFFYLFIRFYTLNTGVAHDYIIRSDGTDIGTFKLIEMGGPYNKNEDEAIVWNKQLYFNGQNLHDSIGAELYVSDGTSVGTKLVKDLDPGQVSFYPGNFLEFNGKLFFNSIFEFTKKSLNCTDGTKSGTKLISTDFKSIFGPINYMNDTLIFCGEHSAHSNIGSEIYFYTLDGNIRYFDINRGSENFGNSKLYQILVTPGNVFFTINDGSGFIHPYVYKRNEVIISSKNESDNKHFEVYPNPVKDFLYIDQKIDLKEISKISVIAENGIEIKIESWNENKINIKNLLPGFYKIIIYQKDKTRYSSSFSKVK